MICTDLKIDKLIYTFRILPILKVLVFTLVFTMLAHRTRGAEGVLKVNKSSPLSLNHYIFSNTEPIYTE